MVWSLFYRLTQEANGKLPIRNSTYNFPSCCCRMIHSYNPERIRFLDAKDLLRRSIHEDAKLCHHRRFTNAVYTKCNNFYANLMVNPFTSQIFKRYKVPGKLNVKYFHTTPTCGDDSNFTPTPEENDPSLAYLRTGKKYLNGPDQLLPSDAKFTWHARGAVRLNPLGQGPGSDRPPISIPSMFKKSVENAPNYLALGMKPEGETKWRYWTYEQYYNNVKTAAKAFIALGLERFHSVCILGCNSPQWFVSNLGAMMAGGIPAGIYTTNSAASCAYVAEDSKANIFVVENEQQLSKILQYRDKLPHLKAIIQYCGKPTCDGVMSWKELMDLGETQSDAIVNERLKEMAINQCSTLIYTSGTTGPPKGVMLSHDNITWLCHSVVDFAGFDGAREEYVSFLPLSHIAAQTADIYFPMFINGLIYFADRDALRGSLINTLREIQPSKFLAVPRVWEKMYESLREIGSKNTGLKLKIVEWAKEQGMQYNKRVLAGHPNPSTWQFRLADKLILSQIRKALGLSRADLNMSAAAPISVDILNYFMSLNIVIGEVYGLSECSGPHTMSIPKNGIVNFGSIGLTLQGAASRLDCPTPDGQGELCIGGRHIQMGYLHREEITRKAFDEEGWLHTEDLAKIDKDGYVYITGRIKELLITAGGENVAPVPIEDNIKQVMPFLSNAMVIGDRLKYLSVFLCFRSEMNPDTNEPLDKLVPSSKEWIEKHGDCVVNTVTDLLDEVYKKQNSKLINAINSGVMLANSKSVSRAQKVQKWVVLPKDFSIPGGELGPTLKLKRSIVIEKYKNLIDEMYQDGQDKGCIGCLG